MPKPEGHRPEGTGIHIRQIPSAYVISAHVISDHVISDIYHFRHSIKIYPNVKVTAWLLYIVTDAEFDGGMLF